MAGATVRAAAAWWALPRQAVRSATRATSARMRRSDGRSCNWPMPESPARGPAHGTPKPPGSPRPPSSYTHADSNTLLKSDSILEYVLETMVYPREHERMRELRLITQQHPEGFVGSSPDQMQFFSMLLKMIGAKNTLEVGMFTAYSLLATALSLPDDCSPPRSPSPTTARWWRWTRARSTTSWAGIAHKVDFREGDGIAVLDRMLLDHHAAAEEEQFDFAYVDADKQRFAGYHERVLRLVRVGGVVAYDNTLWGGSVAVPRDKPGSSEFDRVVRDFVVEFNAVVAADDRVEACLLPIADGVTLCRRVK